MAAVIRGKAIVPGEAIGELVFSDEPLSFWGGYDHQTGEITDRRHPLSGINASGRILALPFTKGSSTTTAVLLESVRAGTAPAAIIICENDSFLALASIVSMEMYGQSIPIVQISENTFKELSGTGRVKVGKDGTISQITDR